DVCLSEISINYRIKMSKVIDSCEIQRKRVPICEYLFEGTMQAAAEAGAANEQRALSYLVSSYPAIYEKAAEAYGRKFLATELEVGFFGVSDDGKVMDVIFSFTKYEANVTEEYCERAAVSGDVATVDTGL